MTTGVDEDSAAIDRVDASPGRSRRWQRVLLTVAAMLPPFLFLAAHRHLSTVAGRENSVDCFYHVQIADMTPPVAYQKTFPWTTMSIWEHHFHDKELLFHLILAGLRRVIHGWFGVSREPPWHAEALFFTALVIAAFVLVGKAWRIPWIHVFAIGLAVISPFFILRITMLRPHNLAIALMLLAAYGGSRITDLRRHWWIPVALGFVFVYGYSNPHFVLLPLGSFALVHLAKGWRERWRLWLGIPLLAVGGLLLGLTIHPQFPNGFIIWRVQCVQVVKQILFSSAPVYIGDEMGRPKPGWIAENTVVLFVLPLVILTLGWLLRRRRAWRELPNETLAICFIALLTAGGCFLSQRTMEYACPFTLLAVGLLVRDLKALGVGASWPRKAQLTVLAGAHALVIGGMYGVPFYTLPRQYPGMSAPLYEYAKWAKQIRAGTKIANVDWSDFPAVFYSAPQIYYSVGLDPMFGYFRDPRRMATLEKFRTGEIQLTPSQLEGLVGTRYIYMSSHLWELSRDLYQAHWFILWQGKTDGWVFDLEQSSAERARLGLKP